MWQVSDLTWAQLAELRWPGREDERVMRVADAVRLTSPFVHCVTLDVKTYQDRCARPPLGGLGRQARAHHATCLRRAATRPANWAVVVAGATAPPPCAPHSTATPHAARPP